MSRTAVRTGATCLLAVFAFLAAAPLATAQVTTTDVTVIDDDGVLTPGDHELLTDRTPDLDLPPEVTRVEYLVLTENDDNFNDSAHEYVAAHRPELLDDPANPQDADRWAPGLLMLGVGLDPQRAGVYCGDDVCAALDLEDDSRTEATVDAMGDSFGDDRFGPGLLEGAEVAADPSIRDEFSPTQWGLLGGILGAAAALVAGAFWFAVRHERKKKAATAREQYEETGRGYGDAASRLEQVDVRANSLTSPLADDRLRRDWEDVKERFLEVDTILKGLPDLDDDTDDKTFRTHADEIERAHTAVTEMRTAETNIEELFRMEHGDATVRRRQLTSLHEDVLEARLATGHEDLRAELHRVGERIDALRSDLEADDFMDRYTDLIGDYQIVVEAVESRELSDVEQHTDRTPPRIYDSDWRAGYGYNSFAPYLVVSAWHAADVQHASGGASGAGVTTGYSGGFTGGGGSGAW